MPALSADPASLHASSIPSLGEITSSAMLTCSQSLAGHCVSVVHVTLQALSSQQQAQQQQWGQMLPNTTSTYAQQTTSMPFSGYCSQAMPQAGFQQPYGTASLQCLPAPPTSAGQLQQHPAAPAQQHDPAPQLCPLMQTERAGSIALHLAFPRQDRATDSAAEVAFEFAGRRQPGQAALAQQASRCAPALISSCQVDSRYRSGTAVPCSCIMHAMIAHLQLLRRTAQHCWQLFLRPTCSVLTEMTRLASCDAAPTLTACLAAYAP